MHVIGTQPARVSGFITVTAPDGTVRYSGPFTAQEETQQETQDNGNHTRDGAPKHTG